MFALTKASDLNGLVQGGQLYRDFLFNKDSLIPVTVAQMVEHLTADQEIEQGPLTEGESSVQLASSLG